jgi:Na+/melibiose symporter-like transporter
MPKYNQYQYGVRIGMYAIAIFSAVQWVYSMLLPTIVKCIRVKPAYMISQLIATVCYVLFLVFDIKNFDVPAVAMVLTAMLAINFCTMNSIPFALISTTSAEDAGLYMGVLNSAAVVAQTVANNIASPIIKWQHDNATWGIGFGAIFSVFACIMVFFIVDDTNNNNKTEKNSKGKEDSPLLTDTDA